MNPWAEPLRQLRAALGKGGNDAQITVAIELLERAATDPARNLDMALAANGPTYRQVAARALMTVPN